MGDEYTVTKNSDGTYNIREASVLEQSGISQDEELYKKDYATASVGLDLQWYIAQDFQKVLCENLRRHSAELDSILPFDDSGLENFDLSSVID